LANAIQQLLIDRDRAAQMGQAGLLRLKEKFTEDKMVESIEQIYSQLWRRH
jgi:glycosyltransferase involved in cell wall biosynthesis